MRRKIEATFSRATLAVNMLLGGLIGCLFYVVVLAVVSLVLPAWLEWDFLHYLGPLVLLYFLIALLIAPIVLTVVRTATWLEGTMLVTRSIFRTRRWDLATAPEVSFDWGIGTFYRGPRLIVRDGHGRTLRLLLRTLRFNLLPASQLRALAAAITAGNRPHPYGERARQAAQTLTQLADNPLTPML